MMNQPSAPNQPPDIQRLKHTYVPACDGIRGIVFTVIFVHLEQFIPIFAGHQRLNYLLIDHTWYTLNLFFCLSGFLITWLLANEMISTNDLNLLRFYKRRVVRLSPAYVTAIILSAVVAFWWGFSAKAILHDSLYFVTYTYNMFRSFQDNPAPVMAMFLAPAWSLCVEEQFYFSWSVAFRRLKMRRALIAVVGALIALRIYRCALFFWMHDQHQWYDLAYRRLYYGTDTRIDAILMGCAAAL